MSTAGQNDWDDEEYSVIGEKGEVGFLDFEEEKSLHNFDPAEDGPVVISLPFPLINGKPQSALIGETSADSISIKNTTDDAIDLWSVRIYSSNPEDSFVLSLMKPPSSDADEEAVNGFMGLTTLEDRVLQPGKTLTIWLSCKPKEIGLHTSVVHFDVGEKIERVVFLLAEDKVSQALFSSKPYSKIRSQERKFNYDQYVGGYRPPRPAAQGQKFKVPQFPIPKDIREVIENKQVPDVIMEGLHNRNYAKYFSTLIVMEEISLEENMRSHDMECVTMRRRGHQFLSLEVPGLAERRPSLVYGDYIFAQIATAETQHDKPYQGYIHRVEAEEVYLKFDKSLHQNHRDDNLYNVRFTYNRTNMRRLYHAVQAAENLGPELLFPSHLQHKRVIKTSKLNPLNQYINNEQSISVEKILGCKGAPPYVIHGPPGTGKTMTLVEAVLQLYTSRRRSWILFCASSNSAADYVLEKLIANEESGFRKNDIFRLNAITRPYEDIKPDLLRFCFFEDMVFKCPSLRDLRHYKIIISTYMSASMLYTEGIRRGNFTHIFLDEAGQASEPETMVPISNLCARETVIVLAGDPCQLGPVIYSRSAESYGLGKSYLERLFECEHYERGDNNYVTKLLRNYRCHPAILELPSSLFYHSELIACKEDNDSFDYDCLEIPNKSFPVYFIGIQGCDEREGNNPSWFNRTEASKVVDIIMKLRRNSDLDEADIGIITPYRQQVLKLKKALESLELLDVKVGTVEQFQGQERQVIIISTVRSTIKHNDFDQMHNLGFLTNHRRFNVAVTRAKSLLIIIGNPHIISKDPYWDKLLRYCADNGSYSGCPLPPPGRDSMGSQNYEADLGDEVPNEYSDEAVSNEVKWGDNPQQYSNEVEWGDIPQQYSLPQQYSNEVERGDIPEQYSNEAKVEWVEDNPESKQNDVDCGEGKHQSADCNTC
ncbi:uncharacterized protein A4U43_C08F18870 [Asparagus officinalis]|uniref:probable RNA helicase SDE3 n=1 Tax=Asparagus officinalis TaxID=4686 RepID=UPI00098E7678|nr:probable RNA helicase SDE3 [Asparagus officinalis]XP_020244563.1 probable RNA helicase SDE3 [Asparagus officinalis]XP_020244564.1 probable RNA helicase SDE3 [Asparagus officinalis]XP_020244565.1 probable RNA helicase SDE3 [Asparagus officinalis]ONK60474.1 uncharacterized protein A4U43_C08F18870 [Asparagus officinalis]